MTRLRTKLKLSKTHIEHLDGTLKSYSSQLILQNLYCKKITNQLQHREDKAKPTKNIAVKLNATTGLLVSCQETEDLVKGVWAARQKAANEKAVHMERAAAAKASVTLKKVAIKEWKRSRAKQLAVWEKEIVVWSEMTKDWPKGKQKPKHPIKPPVHTPKKVAGDSDGGEEIMDLDVVGDENGSGESLEDDGEGL
ncbi:hypothetical protein BS47DRAFT_1392009 [Hydnum rufescens UP504]|uniref:Uncharacterized protein n=1 Tax=Hydnum rufescens UP504 TaxID=1448309 RepID=A0A9P6B0T6_9AGAM|nr:hypothetical protein BS47DRAFT_1392009 [Hydnum rufescens UP504]